MKNQFNSYDIKYKIFLAFLLSIIGCGTQTKDGVQKAYYKTGILKNVQSYQNGVLNGITREYYEGGTLKHAINYKDDRIDGMYHTYHSNGALWTKEIYDNGTFIGRREYNEEGEVIGEESFSKD